MRYNEEVMNIFEALVLGFVQGVTEFMPVSSSGHLEIVERLVGSRGEDFHYFLELINIGTLLALLIFFRKRIWGILNDMIVKKNWRLAINLIITSVPAGILGLLFAKVISGMPFFSALPVIVVAMGGVGILMIAIDKLPKLQQLKNENELTKPRALMIGLAQVLALIPGTSRSGSTIVAGRMVGLDSRAAAEYSFLASIPIMVGVCLKSLISSSTRAYIVSNWQLLVFSNLVAFIFGLIALKLVMNFVRKPNSLKIFGVYRVILASLVLILL